MDYKYILVALLGVILSIVLYYPISYILKKMKAKQTTLHYVEKHAAKSGTQTMGGWIFMLSAILSSIWFIGGNITGGLLCLISMISYGLLGFVDDYFKVKFHQNKGLLPYQKIVGQVGISLILAVYVYLKVGTSLTFFNLTFDVGLFIVPLIVLVFLATTNSVNLIDGLDGLACSVSAVYLGFFALILCVISGDETFVFLCFAMVGALLGFRVFNVYPAKIFMGDTGSMALGGFIASLAALTKMSLILPILGIMYVITAMSDIIQVGYFKRTKKRVFLMAPIHHHFEKKGVHENRIVAIYMIITIIAGGISLLLTLVV